MRDEQYYRCNTELFFPISLVVVLVRKLDSLIFFKSIYKMKMTIGLKRAASRLVVGSISEDGARGRGEPVCCSLIGGAN